MNLQTNQREAFTDSERAEHNKKRSYYTSFLRKKNIQLINAIKEHCATKYPAELAAKESQPHYWDSPEVSDAQEDRPTTNFDFLQNLKRRLWFSANGDLSLYRGFQDGAVSFMGAIDSGHKLDALSNSRRSKQLRKKYWDYFTENSKSDYVGTFNEKVLTPEYEFYGGAMAKVLHKNGEIEKFQESDEYIRLIATGLEGKRLKKVMEQKKIKQFKTEAVPRYFNIMDNCNFLHLVLTVPHDKDGYNGNRFYARDLMAKFNLMRKQPFFKSRVFGGEYSCEIVNKHENGLHVHLHVMLIVYDEKRVRNKLIPEIMTSWNKLTATDNEKVLSEGQKKYLSEYTLTDENNKEYSVFSKEEIKEFNGSGATQISLESLYTVDDKKKNKYSKKLESGKYKNYVSAPNEKDREADPEKYAGMLNNLLSGVMECLKYHFEPFALENENGFDMELVDEILPLIHNLPLYRKFGAFHGVKELNVNFKASPTEQADEIIDEYAAEDVIHPETGEFVYREQYRYFTCDPCFVYHDHNENKKIVIAESRRNYIDDGESSESLKTIMERMIRLSMKPETAINLKVE